jgi:aspartate 1-decarboxylase
MDDAEARTYQPRVVFVDADNKVVDLGADPAHAPEGSGLVNGSTSAPSSETVEATALDALIQAEN